MFEVYFLTLWLISRAPRNIMESICKPPMTDDSRTHTPSGPGPRPVASLRGGLGPGLPGRLATGLGQGREGGWVHGSSIMGGLRIDSMMLRGAREISHSDKKLTSNMMRHSNYSARIVSFVRLPSLKSMQAPLCCVAARRATMKLPSGERKRCV